MCLLRQGCKKLAKEDIICYKILRLKRKYDPENNCYIGALESPYYPYIWTLGEVHTVKSRPKFIYANDIKSGYFHTYKIAVEPDWLDLNGYIICKCVIPAGTWYYEGLHSDAHEGYASKSLKLIEVVKMYNFSGLKVVF